MGDGAFSVNYKIRFVSDDLMPEGHDWIFCRQDGITGLCIRASARKWPDEQMAELLESAWGGYRELAQQTA